MAFGVKVRNVQRDKTNPVQRDKTNPVQRAKTNAAQHFKTKRLETNYSRPTKRQQHETFCKQKFQGHGNLVLPVSLSQSKRPRNYALKSELFNPV